MKVLVTLLWAAATASWAAPDNGHNYQASVPIPQLPQYPPGSYYVQLPDTRFMRVEYLADSKGFQPTVSFVGVPGCLCPDVYSEPMPIPAEKYSEPMPVTAEEYSEPMPIPAQEFSCTDQYSHPAPAPAPRQQYTEPAPAPSPSQQYSQPYPVLALFPAQEYSQPASAFPNLLCKRVPAIYRARQSAIYFLCVLGGAWGALQATYGAPNTAAPPAAHEGYGNANYAFKWDVDDSSSGNFYGHQEERDGDNTQGSYYVQLPDGRLMRVEYYVDDWGFHPTVTFEGEAKYQNNVDQVYGQPATTPSSYYSQPGK
ncbi:zyxin-like [Penaeus chinensis]|uniref:zyxin-like n=1 Tax=Penaeus chinensis TaxID=139456 RepID=UPI001FB6CC8D|nr:zyxin-like [Penaeus chinensis]